MHVPADNSTKPATTEYVRNQGFATKNELSNAVQKYLPLSGGTLSGNTTFASEIHLRPASYPTMELGYIRAENIEKYKFVAMYANNGSSTDPCGGFEAFASDCPSNPSGFNCRARGANNEYYDLAGRKDGSLKWYGKNIVRSVNGINADTNGNVSIGNGVYVSRSWQSGSSWYVVYSNGFKIMGGYASLANSSTAQTVTLPTPFNSANYAIGYSTDLSGSWWTPNAVAFNVYTVSANSFQLQVLGDSRQRNCRWIASGF